MKKTALLIVMLAAAATAYAEDLKLFSFAESLYSSGDYYRAIGEYKRYMFYNPAGRESVRAGYRIGLSYLGAEKYDESAAAFEALAESVEGSVRDMAYIAEAFAYSRKKDYQYSSVILSKVSPAGAHADAAQYLAGFNLLYRHSWDGAREKFSAIPAGSQFRESSARLAELMGKNGEIPQRSGLLAVIMSAIIPGSGYAYCGRWGDAVLSLVFNGYFIYNTVNSFANNDDTGKALYGIPSFLFYTASMYGSAVAAGKFNDEEAAKFVRSAEEFRVDVVVLDF